MSVSNNSFRVLYCKIFVFVILYKYYSLCMYTNIILYTHAHIYIIYLYTRVFTHTHTHTHKQRPSSSVFQSVLVLLLVSSSSLDWFSFLCFGMTTIVGQRGYEYIILLLFVCLLLFVLVCLFDCSLIELRLLHCYVYVHMLAIIFLI